VGDRLLVSPRTALRARQGAAVKKVLQVIDSNLPRVPQRTALDKGTMVKGQYDGVATAFEVLLNSSPNERAVQRFLKRYPYVIRDALNAGAWNSVHLIPEFSFGGEYVADFLILSADSGAWHAVLIELESPTARLFTKNGNPSRALAKGLAQLEEWSIWLRKNDSLFRDKLSAFLESKQTVLSVQAPTIIDLHIQRSEIHVP
jgi:hypothetical protein